MRLGAVKHNVKIRNGKLEIKQVTDFDDGFERWRPTGLPGFFVPQSRLPEP